MHKNQNPFAKEDLFVEIVKLDDNVNKSMRESLENYTFKNHIPSSTLMTQFQKVLTFFTTHTLTAVVTATICLGTIGAFAAQTVAPTEYKPSTVINNLFKNNKIQQINPNTPLISDATNDVVNLKDCGLSLKYPKEINNSNLGALRFSDLGTQYGAVDDDHYLTINFKDEDSRLKYNQLFEGWFTVDCSENIPELDNIKEGSFQNKNNGSIITKEQLAEITGWFISGQNIKNIYKHNPVSDNKSVVSFEYKNNNYWITFIEKVINANDYQKPILLGNQVQIQFNDVTKNIPNVEAQNLNGVSTSGESFKYDVELTTTAVGNYWELTDSKTGDKYLIKDSELNQKAGKLSDESNYPQAPADRNIPKGMSPEGDSYIFSGKVKNEDGIINTPDTFIVTGIDKFKSKSAQLKTSESLSSLNSKNISSVASNTKSVKIIKDIEVRSNGMGLYTSYQDINSNEEYIVKNGIIPGKEKIDEAYIDWNKKLIEKNPGLRYGGSGGTYIFAGEVLDLGNKQYEIVKINKFIYSNSNVQVSPIGNNTIFGGGIPLRTDTVDGIVRTDGPNTDVKNGLKLTGDFFVPKSQSVRATESIDEYSPLSCNIVRLKMYANNSNGMLFVSNANSYISNGNGMTNASNVTMNRLKDYIKKENNDVMSSINAFHSGCGGFASQTMKELGYSNKNGRQTRAVLVATGQEAIADAYVYVFVQQGDKFAMMSTMSYSDIFEKCNDFGYNSNNPNMIKYQSCRQDLMKNNPEVEKFAKEKMQELLTNFEIE
jgi:hypothetical protein